MTSGPVSEIRTLHGLYVQPNTFQVPDGSLEEAENILIKNDFTISSRRGFYEYFDPNTGDLNNLFLYEDVLLAAYNDKIRYYTDTGTAPNLVGQEGTLSGETVEISGTCRSLQANQNFYFTTDNGLLKLTSYNSTILETGAPGGLDLSLLYMNGSNSEWLAPGKIVGYRVLFGYTDTNDNLIIGAPSQIATITNPEVEGTYSSSGVGPYNVVVTTTLPHGYISGQYLTFYDAESSGPTPEPNLEGSYQVFPVTSTTFTYTVLSAPTNNTGTITFAYAMPVQLEFSVPSSITSSVDWFYRIYRSSQQDITVGIFTDFKLISEDFLSADQYSSRVVFFLDDVDDILRGTELYTNENSGEGEQQANLQPPLMTDATLFNSYALYGNCTTRQILNFSIIAYQVLVAGSYIEVKVDALTRRYVAVDGVGNTTVDMACSSSAGLLITYTDHGFLNGYTVYISEVTNGALTPGTYYVISAGANNFKISTTLGGPAVAYGGETEVEIQGVRDNSDYPIFALSTSDSVAVYLATVAQNLVKAINRDTSSVVYAQYTSLPTDIPGAMRLTSKLFTDPIYLRANTTADGAAFYPTLPDSFVSGAQVFSKNSNQPNVIFASKLGIPEAVPIVNFFPVGAKNKAIKRIFALRDSVIILKEDGVFKLTGDNISNFYVTLLDGTVSVVADSSAALLNNQVCFLSNQGICLATDSSVQIISRPKLEDLIQPILGQTTLNSQTGAQGYETERLYLITTTTPNNDEASVTYAYNILTDEWTSWDTLFKQGVVGPEDRLFYIGLDNKIYRERKDQTKIDYADGFYDTTIDSVVGTSATITVIGASPKQGDMIVKDEVITWIADDPLLVSGNTYTCTLTDQNNLEDGDEVTLYASFYKVIKFSPFHGGMLSKMKFYSQFMFHLRNNSCSQALISFSGNVYGGSETVEWESPFRSQVGWGYEPWGFFEWGDTEGINLPIATQPAPIMRTLVPKTQARATYIQARIEHRKAGEALNIQAISYVIRPYEERVSK